MKGERKGKGRQRLLASLVILSTLVVGFAYGMYAMRTQAFPFAHLQRVAQLFSRDHDSVPEVEGVAELISIRTPDDAREARRQLNQFVWGRPDTPRDRLPTNVERRTQDADYDDIDALDEIVKLTISMDHGLASTAYYFVPKNKQATAVIYHQGHLGGFIRGKAQIEMLLDAGYPVLAFSMPLIGGNPEPTVDVPRLGRVKLKHHSLMQYLSTDLGHPVKYLLEPVIVGLNFLEVEGKTKRIAMMGISGGGWTTHLVSAMDPRVNLSVPVAGSMPLFLTSDPKVTGDWEETIPELYRTTNTLEIYILGGFGAGRKQIQVLNRYDTCCFEGLRFKVYEDIVRDRAASLGAGEWDLYSDESHRDHVISDDVMALILAELRSR